MRPANEVWHQPVAKTPTVTIPLIIATLTLAFANVAALIVVYLHNGGWQ